MNLPKMIFIDIDGTLVRKDQTIPKNNENIIKKLKKLGYHIILASGRPYCASITLYKKLGLSSYLITDNGATISLPKNKHFSEISERIDEKDFKSLFEDVKEYTYSALYNIKDEVYIYNDNKSLDYFKHGASKKKVYVGDFTSFSKTPSGALYLVNQENKNNFEDIISNKYPDIGQRFWGTYQSKELYEIYQKQISKAHAIKKVASLLNLSLNEAISFGDGINDIEMFQATKISVAMKNAKDIVKNSATYITDFTNEEGGIAEFILKTFKLNKITD